MGKVVADFQTPPSLTPPEGDVSFDSINNTPIGGVTPSSGAFTTLSASTSATLPQDTTVGGTNVSSALASRASSQVLQFPGTQGRSTATLGVSTIPGARTILVPMTPPSVAPSTAYGLFAISSGGSAEYPYSSYATLESDGRLQYAVVGATGWANSIQARVSGFVAARNGKPGLLSIRQDTTGNVVLGWGNDPLSYTPVTTGTPPAWSDAITGPYLDLGTLGTAGYPLAGGVGAVRILNRYVSDAELATIVETGRLPASDLPATPAGQEANTTFGMTGTGTLSNVSASTFTLTTAGGTDFVTASNIFCEASTKFTVKFTADAAVGNYRVNGQDSDIQSVVAGANEHTFTTTAANPVIVFVLSNQTLAVTGYSQKTLGCLFALDSDQPGYGSTWRDTSGWNADLTIASGVKWGRPSSGDIQVDTITPPSGTVAVGGNLTASGASIDGTVKIGPEEALVVDGSSIKYKGKSLTIESRFSPATRTYGASMALDFDGGGEQVVVLNGNVTFTTANRAAGKELSLLIQPGASARTVTWSEAWHPLGTALPTTIPANKWARLSLKCYGTAATDILAGISIEA